MRLPTGTVIQAEAVLFDMDGTLVNSSAVVERIWRRWAARHGLNLDAILAASHGRRSTETIATFAPTGTDLAREAEWLRTAELTEREGILPARGAVSLLSALPPERLAIVTSATRELATVRLSSAGLPELEIVIAAEDVNHGKPDPEGYVKAARQLAIAPENCLVIEDAPAGLLAGAAAGARVLAVATTLSIQELDDWEWTPDLTTLHLEGGGQGSPMCLRVGEPDG